jgi:hypothetical protein
LKLKAQMGSHSAEVISVKMKKINFLLGAMLRVASNW